MIVFDMDGTLALVGDRIKHIEKTPKDWDSFFSESMSDLPNNPIIDIFIALEEIGKDIIIVTGRDERYRNETLRWLTFQGILIHTRDLYMRPAYDKGKDTEIKKELVADFAHDIEMVFEDRSSVVKMWREMGITCLQVADGDF